MFVKICGTTNLPDAELAVKLGADALGFIFAPSQRRVTVDQAAEMIQFLPPTVEKVGVFTDPEAEAIALAVRRAGLSAVQMHWPYDPATVGAVRAAVGEEIKLWQVVGFVVGTPDSENADQAFEAELREALLDSRLTVVLIDSVKGGASGGQGVAFPWTRAQVAVQLALQTAERLQRSKESPLPQLVVAGGLKAENLREAIMLLRPWGVDVVSGVEIGPGRKDPERMRAFLRTAHEADGADLEEYLKRLGR